MRQVTNQVRSIKLRVSTLGHAADLNAASRIQQWLEKVGLQQTEEILGKHLDGPACVAGDDQLSLGM